MTTDRFWYLFARQYALEATQEELQELELLKKRFPHLALRSDFLLEHKQDDQLHSYNDELVQFETHLARLKEKGVDFSSIKTSNPLPKKTVYSFRRQWTWMAAASFFLLGLGMTWLFLSFKGQSSPVGKKYSEVFARSGTRTRLVLPDSSVVWLNAGSKLTYNEQFGSENRNTILSGEAFFDVKKGSIPFVIHTNSITIKVHGTAFNVRAYDNEKTTETSLIRGKVEVTVNKRPGELYILKPNEKLVVASDIGNEPAHATWKEPMVVLKAIPSLEDGTVAETAWVENKLVFRNESFENLSRRLERRYSVSIIIKSEKLKAQYVTGTLTSETLDEALGALQLIVPFHYRYQDGTVWIND